MTTVILVHGTFANSAEWHDLQGGLSEVIRAAEDVPRFEQIGWSGRNLASSRREAADAIATAVADITASLPDEKIIIIGHSHGGSAVAYFLKQHTNLASSVVGCAFLSTPFIAIRQRPNAARLLLSALFLVFTGLIAWWSLVNPLKVHVADVGIIQAILQHSPRYYWGVFGLVSLLAGTLIAFWWQYRGKSADQIVLEAVDLQTADLPNGEYKFLRCSGDEAAAALSTAQFVLWLGIRASAALQRVLGPLFSKNWTTRLLYSTFLALLVSVGIATSQAIVPDLIELGGRPLLDALVAMVTTLDFVALFFLIFFVFLSVIVPTLFFLGLSIVVAAIVIQAVTSWAFGWTRLPDGFFVDLAVEPLPFGEHSLVHIDWKISGDLAGVVHSWSYSHPAAIRYL